jgi:hypothetical protein
LVGDGAVNPLTQFTNRVNDLFSVVGRASIVIGGLAALLVFLVVLSEQRHGVFGVLAPVGLSASGRADWLDTAYKSWWAGSSHVAGLVLYCVVGWLAIFMVLMQNVVGLVCVYYVLGLPAVAEFEIDWMNPDGHYGWAPVTTVYRTVIQSLAINGITLSFLFVTLGSANFRWILELVVLWVVVLPLYVVVPLTIFGKVGTKAINRHVEKLQRDLESFTEGSSSKEDLLAQLLVRAEVRDVRSLNVHILRPKPLEASALFSSFLLPVVLAVAQTIFSFGFGAHG